MKPVQFSKPIVLLIIIINVWFANKTLNAFSVIGSEPSTLIVAWFGFTTGELWILAGIRKAKIKNKGNEGMDTDEQNEH